MGRSKRTALFMSVAAAAVLTACGAATPGSEAVADEAVTETVTEQDGTETTTEQDVTDSTTEQASSEESTVEGDAGTEVPWHLLPEDDRPRAVAQSACENTRTTPVAC
jgi:hypothetical protein